MATKKKKLLDPKPGKKVKKSEAASAAAAPAAPTPTSEWLANTAPVAAAPRPVAPQAPTADKPQQRAFAYIAVVRSNLKATSAEALSPTGGWEQRLGPRTLLLGDNATGKSRILQACELAVRGKVSDHVGRAEVADAGRLFQLAPIGATELWAEVEIHVPATAGSVGPGDFDQDTRLEPIVLRARWTSKKGAKPKHDLPGVIDPARAFPLVGVREAILGSVDTARRFFFRYAASKLGLAEVWWKIPVELTDSVKAVGLPDKATQGVAPEEVVTSLLAAVEKARRRELDTAAEFRTAAKLIDERAGSMAPEPTEAQMKDATLRMQIAQETLSKAQAAASMGGGEAVQQRALTVRRVIATLEKADAEYHSMLEARPPVQGDEPLAAIEAVLTASVSERLAHCTVCGTPGIPPTRFPERLALIHNVRGLNAQVARERSSIEKNLDRVSNELVTARATLDALEAASSIGPTAYVGPTVAEARAALDAETRTLTELGSLSGQWKTVHADRGRRTNLEDAATKAKACVKVLKEIVGELLESSLEAFRGRVQSFLPSSLLFGIELRDEDGVAGAFTFGLKIPGTKLMHTGLSGAEWAMVTGALAAAVAGESPAGANPLHVLIPEDRAFDPVHLADVMASLGRWSGQVLLGSPTPPARVVPGWTVVPTGSVWARQLPDGSSVVSAGGGARPA